MTKGICRKPLLGACALLFCLSLGFAETASAHFGMVIPSKDMVLEKKDASIEADFAFAHPMEVNGMDLAMPEKCQLFVGGKATDLLPSLKEKKIMDHKGYKADIAIQRPGVYQIAMTPKPYWEEAEDCYIVHYTKAYIAAFGDEDGWQEPLGLKTEIVPLTRPFGNYAGNTFQGQVLLNGKPVAGCDVEVEYFNKDGKYKAPNDYMVTQVVRTDPNGIFTFTVPFAGWWGFAALNTSEEKMDHEGAKKDVELGAVLWTRFLAPVTK